MKNNTPIQTPPKAAFELDLHSPLHQRQIAAIYRQIQPAAGCDWWTGKRDSAGFGQVEWYPNPGPQAPRLIRAHRIVWAINNGGVIPRGATVTQTCRNKACCKYAHLLYEGPNEDGDRINQKTQVEMAEAITRMTKAAEKMEVVAQAYNERMLAGEQKTCEVSPLHVPAQAADD